MNSFSELSQEELNLIAKAPLYIGLLIAEADGFADQKELDWIEKVTFFRIKTAHHALRAYYQLANDAVKSDLNLVKSELSENQDEKMSYLSDKIAEMKPVLAKLDENTKHKLVDSFHSMALSIAEISGGMLSFFSHNPEEEKWLALEMLN
jgi:hypothetical protein